jgi:chemotaxis protein MotB
MRPFLLAVLLLGSACMTTSAHRAQMDELEKLRANDQAAATEKQKALEGEIANLKKSAADADAQYKAELAKVEKSLDDSEALIGALKKQLENLGQNVDKLSGEKGQLAQTLEQAKARLDELRRQEAAAEERAAMFRSLVGKLRSMIDSGQLSVVVRNGKMLLVLPNDVLFDSGRTDIKPAGVTALKQVATALAGVKGRTFLVAGHTDNVPIHTAEFASNWELSTTRAVVVTKLFVDNGVSPGQLAAAGYGEFDPVAPNDTPDHKAQNRRIEIELQPNLSELPSVEQRLQPQQGARASG